MLTSSAIGVAYFGFLLQAGSAVIPLIQHCLGSIVLPQPGKPLTGETKVPIEQ